MSIIEEQGGFDWRSQLQFDCLPGEFVIMLYGTGEYYQKSL